MAYIIARDVAQAYKAKLAEQEPVATIQVSCETGIDIVYHQFQGLYDGMKLYAHPMPADAISSTLEQEVLEMVSMLEAKEWADHVGKSELGKQLEWVISTLHNELWEAEQNHIPDDSKMVAQRQEPVAWRITAKQFCGDFTKDRDIAQHWLEKEPESITPLYLAPTLPLEPSDELIAEIKAVADIRLVNGKAELSNVREIIHTIAHSLSCAS